MEEDKKDPSLPLYMEWLEALPNDEVDRVKLKVPPVMMQRVGRNTVWINMKMTCEVIKRSEDVVKEYITSELMCRTSVNKNHQLILKKGRFTPHQLQKLLSKFIKTRVICTQCKGHSTTMEKDPVLRMWFVCCPCGMKTPINK
jgi:translation initiation factor 2 beta subunit (eIF-2beta)/eIF-5